MLKKYFRAGIRSITNPHYSFSATGAVKILRENDPITQSDIDSILGNEPT